MILRLYSLSIFLLLTACGGGSGASTNNIIDDGNDGMGQTENPVSPTPVPVPMVQRGTLVSSTLLATNSPSLFIPYSVDAYRVIYNTIDTNNASIKASGLLSIPKKNGGEKSPLLSYQHATIFLDTQAPSNSSISADPIMNLAGTGYIVSAPDYIGYGESSGQIHPFLHADSLASVSIDMLKASMEFLLDNNISTNGQLFLAGYSEGGYATLALQKNIQENGTSGLGGLSITASAAGAGPFDLSTTATILANQSTNERPAYMSFLLKAYDSVYALDQVSDMYQTQYIDTINSSFDGQHSSGTINSNLSHSTSDVFESSFLDTLQNVTNSNIAANTLKEKLALNNIYDWKPNAPTRFYHSPSDEIVPYSNSQKALSAMNANGASNVSLRNCPLSEHTVCAIPYIIDTISFFSNYVNDL